MQSYCVIYNCCGDKEVYVCVAKGERHARKMCREYFPNYKVLAVYEGTEDDSEACLEKYLDRCWSNFKPTHS